MNNKPYHHGNLRTTLIETGIELVSREGIKDFSLRKVAATCGVSHTAPYSHFKNIDALTKAMGEHVTEQFTGVLIHALQDQTDSRAAISSLGNAYISFFQENPFYFQFLFYSSGINIDLNQNTENDYPPFVLFRETAFQLFQDMEIEKKDYTTNLLTLWSMVHGAASLLTNEGVHYTGDWTQILSTTLFSGGTHL